MLMLVDQSTMHGFMPAAVTPFSSNGEIMEDAFQEVIERHIANGVDGICVAGDNGESWSLITEERRRLTRLAVDRAKGRTPIFVGCTSPSTSQTLTNARAAVEDGADGLLAMPQTYVLKATREELLQRFDSIARAADLPIILYDTPRRSGIELTLDDIDAAAAVSRIVAIKASNRDFFRLTHMIERFRGRIAVMVGPGHYIIPGLVLGAPGFIATGPEFMDAKARRILELARRAPGPELTELHLKLTRLYEALMSVGTWPAALKTALNLLGWPAGEPRDPVLPLSPDNVEKIRHVLRDLGFAVA
jgi:4-hydroxy-tetrahydrodipicolinate synthase